MTLEKKFDFLEDLLLNKRDTIGIHTGVPFIQLIYDPEGEIECKERRETLREKLISSNLKVLEIPAGKFIFETFKEKEELPHIFEYEKESPKEVRNELTNRCRNYFKDWLLKRIEIENPDIVFLIDIPGLYPYYRLSAIFTSLETEVKTPLVAFYPGVIKENGKLYFLGERESNEYYRAMRI